MRKTVNVYKLPKKRLDDIKLHLDLKSDSEAVAYLTEFYNIFADRLTLAQHKKILEVVNDLHSQAVMEIK